MRMTASSTACCRPAATSARSASGIGGSVGQAEPLEEARAETAVSEALRAEETAIEARAGFGDVQDLQEQIVEAAVAGDGEPLDLVLVHAGARPSSSVTRP